MLFRALAFFPLLMGLVACNTMEGLGKDIQSGGEALEDAAESTKRALNE